MNHTVIGIFDTEGEANTAVDQLISSGFSRNTIDFCSKNAFTNEGGTNKATNFFGSLFDKEDDFRNHYDVANRGCTVTVHATSREEAQKASGIMDQFGAVDVDERAMQYRSHTDTGYTTGAAAMDADKAIPVIEEELQVGKHTVQTGGVRLRSRIIERPVEEHLRLREEHVHVERNPLNQPVSTADLDSFREETIEMREQTEVPVVNKDVRVVEEVSLSKEVEEHDEVIKDSVRHTEVEVEDLHDRTDLDNRTDFSNNLHTSSTVDTDTDATFLDKSHKSWSSALHRMKEVEDDYKIASDDPDVRGWDVLDSAGSKIGEVDELIVDTQAMKVRYLEVDVDNDLFDVDDDHHILLPIGSATLDYDNKHVMVSTLSNSHIANYPAYRGEAISRDYEHRVLSALTPGYQQGNLSDDRFYEGDHFSSGGFSRPQSV